MTRRRKTATQDTRVQLNAQEIEIAAQRMMAAAQAHQRASGWCMDKPDTQLPNIDSFFFGVVSFELVLLSVEQSLRLLLLLHYSIIRDGTDHNLRVLYGAMLDKSGGKEGIRRNIVDKMNFLGQTQGIDPISERELKACLKGHDSSYSNFRYFQLDRQARLNVKLGFSQRDVQILHCLALALIHLNMDEMVKRGIGALLSMSPVPGSEMTEEMKALRDRILS